ncbi:hypothetical protein ES703_81498 [subsurface metagenome]
MLVVDGVARKLYPHYNIMESVRPYMRSWFFKQYSPKRYMKEILILLDDINYFLKYLPAELSLIIKKIRFGQLKLPMDDETLI